MRPTKLLTISAIAGLSLISYGNSAYAAPVSVSVGGEVLSSCTFISAAPITPLSEIGEPPTQLAATGAAGAKIVIACNDANKKLNLTISSSSQLQNGTPSIKFVGATIPNGGGIFASTNTPYQVTAVPTIVNLIAPTKALGDTGYVWAKIDPPEGKLLKAGDYNLVVTATITP